MEKLIRWFVSNKVVSNLLMILIIVTGATTIPMLKMEVFPEIDLNIISVSAVYPGATPSDDLLALKVSPGKAYVRGYDIERPATTVLDLSLIHI